MGSVEKIRACTICKQQFQPRSAAHKACGVECAAKLVRRRNAAKAAKAMRAEEAAKRKKPSRSTGPVHQAQQAVNAFVLERDHDQPCILHGASCKRDLFDAGHMIPVSESEALRFNLKNIYKQCRSSNRGAHNRKRFNNNTGALFREGVIERHGRKRVTWLKSDHPEREYSVDELKRIASIFWRRTRLYRRLRQARAQGPLIGEGKTG